MIKTTPKSIVPGRLYGYRGAIVRAGRRCNNNKRHISFHKMLHGFVNDGDLQFIDKSKVKEYLQYAN